ncbi:MULTISPECIES: hypothetical protein [unclassified Microbacterium]|uniref:hypothetical protein n=1 Tax=unclassified Microbacterium TaxID=2609290 RepID=UPI003426E0A0
MNDYKKGDTVVVTRDGYGHYASGGGGAGYVVGEELVITSTRSIASGYLNVRPAPPGDGMVFRIPTDRVRPVPRMIGEIPAGGISPEDPRIAWLFEDAGRMADRLGLCADYDRLCDALGIPGRVRTFTVSLLSGDGITVTAKVEARSKRLAEQRVRERLSGGTETAAPLVLEASRLAEVES